ncbi:MAG TPA: hypothetical protein VGH89_24850 [Pseudonocardia sp.]|jgi:hypothetical protein
MPVSLEPVPDLTVSPAVHIAATLAAGLVWLGVLIFASVQARRHRSPIPLLFLLGGALTVGFEPIVDTLGKCYLPRNYQWTMFTVLDRPMPVYAVLVYSAFFGGFALMAWSHLRRGGAPSELWRKYALAIAINTFLFETPAVPIFHVYTYYGNQPFDFWGFPLWWPFVNTAGPLVAGALVYVLQTHLELPAKRLLPLAVLLVPMGDGFSNAASAYPTWLALNSAVPAALTWGAGALTIGLATLIVHGMIRGLTRIADPVQPRPQPAVSPRS